MALDTLQHVESYIRDMVKDRNFRIKENFYDFDPLRSGCVTANQFFRVLRKLIGVPLRAEQEKLILDEYGENNNADINWRKFSRSIEGVFDENDFSVPPECKVLKTIELLASSVNVGIKAKRAKSGDEDFGGFRALLSRINQFITCQGHIIRDCYRQFDTHNMGVVTESQFYRFFPGPPDITDAELTALADRYKSLTKQGFVNYLDFENDLRKLASQEKLAKDGIPVEKEAVREIRSKEDFLNPSQHMIMDRIRFAVHRRGIRVLDFFVDYDKLRHDQVTEQQFVCALLLAVGKEASLNRNEVQMLANYFRSNKDPRLIRYREFCRTVDSPFHALDLEKDPLKRPEMPPPGALSKAHVTLSPDEESRVSQLLNEMRAQVDKRRILTYPYFHDYSQCGVITPSQFARVLHFLGLDVSNEDCRRICRKFADPETGNVNFIAFCSAIDSWYSKPSDPNAEAQLESNIEWENNPNLEPGLYNGSKPIIGDSQSIKQSKRCDWDSTIIPIIRSAGDHWPIDVLMDRIRHLVLVNRIPLKSFFVDFDPLRSGFMTKTRFERCLTTAGLTRLNLHDLTPAQIDTLTKYYARPENPNEVHWTRFVEDVNSVFTLPGLEKEPLTRVLPQETFVQPRPGTADWSTATEEMKENFERSMSILRRKIFERRMLLAPDFLAFDHLHRGVVTPHNFRQLVSMCGFSLAPAEVDAILARYTNDDGFDYRAFLDALDPPPSVNLEYKYPQRLESLQKTNIKGKEREEIEPVVRDTEGVLDHLKADVYRRRLRLSDCFRDFDKLNHGYVPRVTFRRCLGVLPVRLNETAMAMIEDRYKGPQPETIDWRSFCEEIETIFQSPHLDKDPLKEPEPYFPDSIVGQNYLSTDLAKIADNAVSKMANKVRQRRLQLHPMFSDFDETHRLTVSQNQFRRVLMTLDLADLVSELEWTALYCKYRHPLGIVDNINYQAFIDDVYTAAGMDKRVP